MKINMAIIRDELSDLELKGLVYDESWICRISYPYLYDGSPDSGWDEDALYIAAGKDFPDLSKTGLVLSFLCIGAPGQSYKKMNVLYTEKDIPAFTLMNRLQHIFKKYQDWDSEVRDAIVSRRSFPYLGRLFLPFTRNSVSVLDANYVILFLCYPEPTEESPDSCRQVIRRWTDIYTDGLPVPSEDITYSLASKEYRNMLAADVPVLHSAQLYGYRSLVSHIRNNGSLILSIIIDELPDPLTDYHMAIISIIREYIVSYLNALQAYNQTVVHELDSMTLELLEHRHMVPETQIGRVLDSYGWQAEDAYFCFLIRPQMVDIDDKTLIAFAHSIGKSVSAHCQVLFRHQIFFVVNLSHTKCSKEHLIASITPFLRDNLLLFSGSCIFHDYKLIYYFYQLAKDTLAIGQKKDPTAWIFQADDYLPDVLQIKILTHYRFRHRPHHLFPEVRRADRSANPCNLPGL